MGRSIADKTTSWYHEAIKICQDGSYNDADNKKSKRVPPYLHRCSNHVYTIWQHLVLLTLRQYECKSYRRFVDFLQESFGVVQFLGLSRIPHYITMQKAAARLRHGILLKILESFVLQARIRNMFAGIDSTGLSYGQASWYYTKRYKLRRKFVKISTVQT